MELQALDAGQARRFAERWLPAWTGNRPEHRGSIPLEHGFLNLRHASLPAGGRSVELDGVCTVQLRAGRIYSNQVFFDRSELLRSNRPA